MAGLLAKLFVCVFIDQDPAILTEQAWSIKDFLLNMGKNTLAGHSW